MPACAGVTGAKRGHRWPRATAAVGIVLFLLGAPPGARGAMAAAGSPVRAARQAQVDRQPDGAQAGATTTLAKCTFAALQNTVATGGVFRFACSGTIDFTQELTLSAGESVTLDGSGSSVVLDGQGKSACSMSRLAR